MKNKHIKIGTRGSTLALWQANHVQALLKQRFPDLTTEIIEILTSGDWSPSDGEKRLSENKGGKAQFAKEIEEKLLDGTIDIAVHSMKDMDSFLPSGLEIPCILPREEAQDALLLRDREGNMPPNPADWPKGTTIGTSSIRRQAMLLAANPHLNIIPLRGNVETRISKLRGDLQSDFKQLDITLLALAGLKRLGQKHEIDKILDEGTMLPAAAQGAIGIEIASNKSEFLSPYLSAINCTRSHLRITAERAVLAELNGTCHTPIGIYAKLGHNKEMRLDAHLLSPDGRLSYKTHRSSMVNNPTQAKDLALLVADDIKANASPELIKASLT